MEKLIVNNVELALDLLDADVLEKYETLNTEIVEKIKEPAQYEGLSNPAAMRLQCRIIDGFFDELFGAGTAEKVFGAGSNLGIRMDGFGAVAQFAASSGKRIREIQNKYTAGIRDGGKGPQDFKGHGKNKHNNRPRLV